MGSYCMIEDYTDSVQTTCSDVSDACPPKPMSTCSVTIDINDVDMSICLGAFGSYPYMIIRYTCEPSKYTYMYMYFIELLFVFVEAVFVAPRAEELGIAT